MKVKAFHHWLEEKGYTGPVNDPVHTGCVYFYRKVPDSTHQWVIREWELIRPNVEQADFYELEMCYEACGGVWVESKFYNLSVPKLRRQLRELEKRLYTSVEPMGGDPKSYDRDREETTAEGVEPE